MRKALLVSTLVALFLAPAIASAKLPYFDLEVAPLHPSLGEPITLTMTCFDDAGHTEPWSSCLGAGGVMAWVHPLDEDGSLERTDWIRVEGHRAPSGASQGTITLTEPGSYDVLPLSRGWGSDQSPGFPDPIRIEVGNRGRLVPITLAALGAAAAGLVVAARRRRALPVTVTR